MTGFSEHVTAYIYISLLRKGATSIEVGEVGQKYKRSAASPVKISITNKPMRNNNVMILENMSELGP